MSTSKKPARRAAKTRAASPPRKWKDRFLASLAETSNVTAAADGCGISIAHVYKTRRADPEFAKAWFAALAEGYDNLEMELLARLRSGQAETTAADGSKCKFDTATAFRCLAAHRENVAREKGRRTLAEEVVTIESINAKIDRLRLNRKATDAAVARVRKARRAAAAKSGSASDAEG